MERRWLIAIAAVVGSLITLNQCFFTVPQWKHVIVIQLGNPQRTIHEPGLYVKLPFVQNVIEFDRRLLLYDAAPKEVLTRDKQQLVVDNYARWRIVDPLLYYKTVRNEAAAQSRLDDIIYSNVRENFGRQTLRDIVTMQRTELMAEITKRSDERARDLGIQIVDVRVKRADLPEKNEQNVFLRMRAERERQAKKFRAEGQEEARKIRSEAEKQVQILLAEARKKAEISRGEGDAQAVNVFAEAYGRDLDFFEFQRSLAAYRKSMTEHTTLVLTPDAEFFRFLQTPNPRD